MCKAMNPAGNALTRVIVLRTVEAEARHHGKGVPLPAMAGLAHDPGRREKRAPRRRTIVDAVHCRKDVTAIEIRCRMIEGDSGPVQVERGTNGSNCGQSWVHIIEGCFQRQVPSHGKTK